jgi:4-amino-4-deoxy-L-arabinose transferase-like glycosyltransferase
MRPATAAWLVALLGWTVMLCFYELGGGARFEPIDCWVSQTAREMYPAGQWLVPRFSGEPRIQKSPGPYWAVMLSTWLRGQIDVDEVSARIPSAIAAVVLVMTIFWLTRHIAGDRAAVFAGFAASSSILVLWWSHRAASDLGLAALTTLSLAALWIGSESTPPGPRRHGLWLLGYLSAGLAMLYKMPIPVVAVGLPALLYLVLRNRWSILKSRWHLVGLGLFLLAWLPWAVAVSLAEDAALTKWKVEFIDRFTGTLPNVAGQGGLKNILFYLPMPLLYCLPFTLSLPAALVGAFRKQPGVSRNGTLFAAIWFLSLLVFFTASTGKEYRYLLPGLPPLFVLLGIELARLFDPQRRRHPSLDWAGAISVWVLVPGVLLVGGWLGLRRWWELRGELELYGSYAFGDVWAAYLVAATILAVGFGLAAWLYLRRRTYASFGTLVATMWATWLWAWPNVMPHLMSQRAFTDFADQLVRMVPPAARANICMAGSQDSRIIWYSDVRYPRVIDQLELLLEQQERYRRGEQQQRRDLDYEMRRYGEEMVKWLDGDELSLFVIPLEGYVQFLLDASAELEKRGRDLPPIHLWLQTRYGNFDRHYVLFGNRPPPFRPPELRLPDKTRARLVAAGVLPGSEGSGPTNQPVSQPAGHR